VICTPAGQAALATQLLPLLGCEQLAMVVSEVFGEAGAGRAAGWACDDAGGAAGGHRWAAGGAGWSQCGEREAGHPEGQGRLFPLWRRKQNGPAIATGSRPQAIKKGLKP